MPTTRSATAAASGAAPKPSSSSKPPASPMRPSVKRSASIASLPTPPQTLHKRRGRGRAHAPVEPIAEEPEEGDLPTVEPPTRSTRSKSRPAAESVEAKHGRKRQRVDFGPSLCDDDDAVDAPAGDVDAEPSDVVTKPTVEVEEAEEDAFWLDKPSPKKGQSSTVAEPPSPGGLLDQPNRVKVRAPVSPPPSRHRPRPPVTPKAKVSGSLFLVAPVTPPRRTLRSGPVRDSGNNPFLEESPGSQLTLSPPNPLSPTPHAEPPTLTYVFRGTRALVANPHFRKDPELEARSQLPVEHPDYEPLESCAPRRLFVKEVAEIRRRQPARQAKLSPRTPSPKRGRGAVTIQAEASTSLLLRTPPQRTVAESPKAALDKALGPVRGARH